jgi:hypothetical protein
LIVGDETMSAPPTRPAAYEACRALLATASPPSLGPERRPEAEDIDALEAKLDATAARHGLHGPQAELVRALVLLWHDHLDAAHRVVQDLPQREAAWIHAIMHRREPDYWNSKYWWRRVGAPPAFSQLAAEVRELLAREKRSDLAAQLAPSGRWDPGAFVDVCEAAAKPGAADASRRLLESIQAVEFDVLLRTVLAVD